MRIQLPKGVKKTPQRLAIIKCLEGNKGHPSAEDIYREVRRDFPTMSLATVYNTLDALKEHGYVFQLSVDPKRKRYDPDTSPHHHLICSRCKRIVDIHRDFDIHLPEPFKKGYKLLGSHIEFYGICPTCKGSKEEKDDKKRVK